MTPGTTRWPSMAVGAFVFAVLVGCSMSTAPDPAETCATTLGGRRHDTYPTPPAGFTAALPMLDAVHYSATSESSAVEVDWLRLWAGMSDGRDTLLAALEFGAPDRFAGGLYERCPWFATNVGEAFDGRAVVANGVLRLLTSRAPERVFHVFGESRALVPVGVRRVWAAARVRAIGRAAIHVGFDHWRDLTVGWGGLGVNNCEGGMTEWYMRAEWDTLTTGP